MAVDLDTHPCFSEKAKGQYGRIHLPVAPKCNIQCNFCDRKYACANENRPGVTVEVLSPGQSIAYLKQAKAKAPHISVMGIAGPGDPFANPAETMETLRRTREAFPEMLLCVATNGLGIGPYIPELAALETSHVTLTVNAVDPEIGAKVYAWVRDGKTIYRGKAAAAVLLERQLDAIKALKQNGIIVKINTILIPGVNDEHVEAIAKMVKSLGADLMNIMPLKPVADTPFGALGEPDAAMVQRAKAEAGAHLPLMHHCTRCRADACGMIGKDDESLRETLQEAAKLPINPEEERPYVAAASMEGMLVNMHLGEAKEVHIFKPTEDGFETVEVRACPPPGGGTERWMDLARRLSDCRAILVSSVGQKPVDILEQLGVKVVMMEGMIQEGLEHVYDGTELRAPTRKHRCGSGCGGDGMGCA